MTIRNASLHQRPHSVLVLTTLSLEDLLLAQQILGALPNK
jgi:hypothetical protein